MNNVSFAEGPRDVPVMLALGALWLAWAALLFGGFALGRPSGGGDGRIPRIARLGSSGVLAFAAWVMAFFASEDMQTARGLIAVGMTLCLTGDWAMARRPPALLAGMGLFALGHAAYIGGFISIIAEHPTAAAVSGLRTGEVAVSVVPLVLLWILCAAAWYVVVWRPAQARTREHVLALPYALLLATTAGAAYMAGDAYADLHGALRYLAALGAGLFLLSDLALAAGLFNGMKTRGIAIGDIVWLLYGPGQMLIVFGSLVLTVM
jgi:hypothetical protein